MEDNNDRETEPLRSSNVTFGICNNDVRPIKSIISIINEKEKQNKRI